MEPNQILQNMADRYSQCRSYSDSGIVLFTDVKQQPVQLRFNTNFIRPDYLTFEWQDYGPNRGKSEQFSLLWSDQGITCVRDFGGLERAESLHLAVAGATGCSAAAASIVPSLLLEEIRRDSMNLLTMTDLKLLRRELFKDLDCFVLQGSLSKQHDHMLWVAVSDFSLRRVYIDRSWTAEESKRNYETLLAQGILIAPPPKRGIAPPAQLVHKDTRLVSDYVYNDIAFDQPIDKIAQPRDRSN